VGDKDRENRRVEKINRNMTTRTSKVIFVFIFFSPFEPSGEVDARALRLYSRYTQYYTRIIPPLLRAYLLCVLYIYIYISVCVCVCVCVDEKTELFGRATASVFGRGKSHPLAKASAALSAPPPGTDEVR